MKALLNRKLVIVAVAIAILGGSAGAVAATQGTGAPPRQAFIDDVANRLGVTPSALTAAIKGALTDRIDAAVAAGRLTAAQGAALQRRLAAAPAAGRFEARL